MDKLISIEKLQNEIIQLKKYNKELEEQNEKYYMKINISHPYYKTYINKNQKQIEKNNNKIEQFEYQISLNGRKLKSAIMISKDLSNNGFVKAEWFASGQIRGWGHYSGDFTVENNSTCIKVKWQGKSDSTNFENFKIYLLEKYKNDYSIDGYNTITIKK